MATPDITAIVATLMADLELTFGGGSRGDSYALTVDGTPVDIVFDKAVGLDGVQATAWVDDENGDAVQVATLRLTAVVIA